MKLKAIKTVLDHPLSKRNKLGALKRFFKRGVVKRLHKSKMIYPFIENTRLSVSNGMSNAELQIYTGVYDLNETMLLLHFMEETDVFVDVGANVGIYSVLMSGIKGSRSIAFEPIETTYKHLLENVVINGITDKVFAYNIGIGSEKKIEKFTNSLDAINHIATEEDKNTSTIEVQIDTLDNILRNENPTVLKIDVEGFETEVIKGALETIKKQSLKIVIIELNGLSERYGFEENKIHKLFLDCGFEPYDYEVESRTFIKQDSFGIANTIYVRDIDYVKSRTSKARKYKVLDYEF